MLINLGRLLMLCVWGFLLSNLFHPFPKPLKYFIDVALFFMVVMHGLQLVLLKSTQPKDQPISYWQEAKILSLACSSCWPGKRNSRPSRRSDRYG